MNDPDSLWDQLSGFLEPRQDRGWRLEEEQSGSPIWAYGLGGAALLVAEVSGPQIHLFDYIGDSDYYFDSVSEFASKIDGFERQNRGITPLQKALIEDGTGSVEMLEGLQDELARQDHALDIGPTDSR